MVLRLQLEPNLQVWPLCCLPCEDDSALLLAIQSSGIPSMPLIPAMEGMDMVEALVEVSVIRLHCAIKFIDASPREGSVMDKMSKISRRIVFMSRSVS